MSHIFIRLDEKIYLVIFGGSPDSITVEYFEYIEDGLKTQLGNFIIYLKFQTRDPS